MRVDHVEAGKLAAELRELSGDFLDLRFGNAQLVEIGARRDVAENRIELRLELVEAAPERGECVLGTNLGERLLDARRDVGKALVEVVRVHRAAALRLQRAECDRG